MYRYDTHDHALVAERVAQFRDQTQRFMAGKLAELARRWALPVSRWSAITSTTTIRDCRPKWAC